ncbi:WAP four-disulfide core domain protein 2 [Rhynchonycteris naso]
MTASRRGLLVASLVLALLVLGFSLVTGSEAEKTGVCPELEEDLNCTQECRSDGECADNLKCCRAGCATVCLMPNEKQGSCPQVDMPLTPLGLCRNQCQVDSECSGHMKCCRNGCGKVSCVTPVF